jgi:hypothetical protein
MTRGGIYLQHGAVAFEDFWLGLCPIGSGDGLGWKKSGGEEQRRGDKTRVGLV